jgi:hypothetical protein
MNDADRFWSKVDTSAGPRGCWLWTASTNGKGYGWFRFNGESLFAHRVLMTVVTGEPLGNLQVDHRCRVKNCVNPMHLRLTTNKQNHENLTSANRNSKSGIRGVAWSKVANRWEAHFTHNGRAIHVGYFDTAEEADEAIRLKRLEVFTHNDADRIRS